MQFDKWVHARDWSVTKIVAKDMQSGDLVCVRVMFLFMHNGDTTKFI